LCLSLRLCLRLSLGGRSGLSRLLRRHGRTGLAGPSGHTGRQSERGGRIGHGRREGSRRYGSGTKVGVGDTLVCVQTAVWLELQ
jgi:hypothetical protein